MRLFIAFNFDDEAKSKLLRTQAAMRHAAASGNFTRPENLHLTLVFLGETPQGRVGDICRVMDSAPSKPLTLQFAGTGKFGDTWWVGIEQNPALAGLYNQLTLDLKEAGFPIEGRPFKPHLTLAREVRLPDGTEVAEAEGFSTEVRAIHLMKSERVDGRLIYTSIYEKQLT
jgi:2'-5' RNA ligase